MNIFNDYLDLRKGNIPNEAISNLSMLLNKNTQKLMMTYLASFTTEVNNDAIIESMVRLR